MNKFRAQIWVRFMSALLTSTVEDILGVSDIWKEEDEFVTDCASIADKAMLEFDKRFDKIDGEWVDIRKLINDTRELMNKKKE